MQKHRETVHLLDTRIFLKKLPFSLLTLTPCSLHKQNSVRKNERKPSFITSNSHFSIACVRLCGIRSCPYRTRSGFDVSYMDTIESDEKGTNPYVSCPTRWIRDTWAPQYESGFLERYYTKDAPWHQILSVWHNLEHLLTDR